MRGTVFRLWLLLMLLGSIHWLHLLRPQLGSSITLSAGALLLAGLFAGKLARHMRLPRLTGYLLIGMVVGPYVLGFLPKEGVKGLELVKGMAVSLIALAAGTELQLGLLRRVGRPVLKLGAAVSAVVFLASSLATLALHRWIPIFENMTWTQTVAVSALLATVVVSFSPTVTIAIIQETQSRGSFTEFLLALVILGDLVVMVGFAVAGGLTKASFGGRFGLGVLAGDIGWELFGSVALGAVVGLLALFYLKWVGRELPIFILALCFGLAEIGTRLHLSPLLQALAAGAVIANLDERHAQRLNQAIETAGLPVFALFFAAAGAGLQLGTLKTVGLLAVVLVAVRGVAIYLSAKKLAPDTDERLKKYLWMGLISQAGVTFGLASLVSRTFPSFGPSMEVLIVAMVTVHELIGPVLMRRGLWLSGEIRQTS